MRHAGIGHAMSQVYGDREVVPFIDLAAMTREVRTAVCDEWSAILDSSRFIGGEVVERFETQWAEYCDTSHCLGVANGTDALQLTLRALGIRPGDEVVVPANTFIATAASVVLAGGVPRFADVDPQTLLLTANGLAEAITDRTGAVIVVHLYGQMPDMDGLCQIAQRAGIALIEDAAQAHGAKWRNRRAGSFGLAGCFSFYPGKNLGAFGDAGAVVTSDADLAARIRSIRDHGRLEGSHYEHVALGTNSRLDAVQAAVLSAKLARLDRWTDARRAIAARYRVAFADGMMPLVEEHAASVGVYHLAVARVPNRARAVSMFTSLGVQTAVHYPTPCHLQPPFQRFARQPLPVAERAANEVLSLPMFPHMTAAQVTRVCDASEVVSELLVAREVAGA
jgi:dTDP-4-amino-4,6-dideoxygalactose transaminase